MNTLVILIVAILPVLLLLGYIYKTDPIPEPTPYLRKAFLYGVMIAIPAVAVEGLIAALLFGGIEESQNVAQAVSKAFLMAALPEEGLKLFALWLILRKNPYFDEHFDGIVYAVFVSLGFAGIENVGYLFSNAESFLQVGILRALMAVPGHYAFGVLMGFFYSLYYFVNRSMRNKVLIFVAPFLAHGIYDGLLFVGQVSQVFGGIGFVLAIIFCIWLHRYCFRRIRSHIRRDQQYFG